MGVNTSVTGLASSTSEVTLPFGHGRFTLPGVLFYRTRFQKYCWWSQYARKEHFSYSDQRCNNQIRKHKTKSQSIWISLPIGLIQASHSLSYVMDLSNPIQRYRHTSNTTWTCNDKMTIRPTAMLWLVLPLKYKTWWLC